MIDIKSFKRRPRAGAVPAVELKDKLDRARAALEAVKRAPVSKAALKLELDLTQQVRRLERDVAR